MKMTFWTCCVNSNSNKDENCANSFALSMSDVSRKGGELEKCNGEWQMSEGQPNSQSFSWCMCRDASSPVKVKPTLLPFLFKTLSSVNRALVKCNPAWSTCWIVSIALCRLSTLQIMLAFSSSYIFWVRCGATSILVSFPNLATWEPDYLHLWCILLAQNTVFGPSFSRFFLTEKGVTPSSSKRTCIHY